MHLILQIEYNILFNFLRNIQICIFFIKIMLLSKIYAFIYKHILFYLHFLLLNQVKNAKKKKNTFLNH